MDFVSISFAIAAAAGAFGLKLLTSEIQDWLPVIARKIISFAAQRLPSCDQQRHFEQWLADNNDYPGKLGKIWHAVGCLFAANALTRAATDTMKDRKSAENDPHPSAPALGGLIIWERGHHTWRYRFVDPAPGDQSEKA